MTDAAVRGRTAALALALATVACGGDDERDDGGSGADAGPGLRDAGAGDAVLLPGETFHPEGIAALADGTLFVGSLVDGTIVRVPPGALAPDDEPFVEAGDNAVINTIGIQTDEERGLLWACSSDLGISPRTGTAPPGLKAFDLETGAPAGSFDLPGGGFCNDVNLDGEGNVYVTDSFAPRILRLAAGGAVLQVWAEDQRFAGEGFNLNGLAVTGAGVYTVKYNSGQLFRVSIDEDGTAGEVIELSVDPALESPDGLRVEVSGSLLVVEGVGRLTRLAMNGETVSRTVLFDELDGPASVAIAGEDGWVTETQLVHLIDPDSGAPDLPFRVERVRLR